MDWIELVNMEYGECVVLGTRRGEILMVDCGSVNQILRDGDVPLSAWYETLGERYAPAQDRYFLLTHYHKDHIAGFFKLLEREEGYFHRVFLPRAPADEDRPPPAAGVRPVRLPVPAHPVGGLPGEHRLRPDVPHLAGKAGRGQDLQPWGRGTGSPSGRWTTRCCGPGWRTSPSTGRSAGPARR